MLAPKQEKFLLVKHPSPVRGERVVAGEPPRTGFFLTWAGPYSSQFTDTKADKPDPATCKTQPKARCNFLQILVLGLVGARGFEPPTSRTRTVRSSQAELRPVGRFSDH